MPDQMWKSGHLTRRGLAALMGGAGILALAPGRFGGPSAAMAQQTGELRIRIGADISILDPAKIFQIENQSVAANIYNGLVKYDQATNKIVPDLATEWTVSPDGKTYTFKLREGVTWHRDNGPFTSDDVKFSFERILDPAAGSAYRGQFVGVKAVEAPDPQTVRIELEGPNAGFLHKVTAFNQGWIVSRKAVTALGDKYNLNPVGTGPFVFERWTPGSEVRLSANPNYFEGKPKVAGVVFRLVRDETAAAIALERKEIDILFAIQQAEIIERLRKVAGVTLLDRPASNGVNLVLNTTMKPLDDVRVRRAMAHAINTKALIDGFFRGTKYPAANVLTPAFQEYTDEVPAYPYDPAKAKALLKEAGVSKFKFEITTVGLNPYDKFPLAIAEDLNEVGIEATVKVLERAAYQQARSSGNIQSCITAVVGPPDPGTPLTTLYSSRSFPPGLNTARYDKVDDLLAATGVAADEAARKKAFKAVLEKTMTDLPVIPLYADRLFMAHTAAVEGLVQNSMFTIQAYSVGLRSA
ncbi:ABC transporter substrate-binding protein [Enterovirga sp. CN4-39]|uniref:ABC transporter substrate-binding protein n=1 Tax=Enterovirga sp. CN4-39 TaxID=3400910 RepID=UPI003C0FA31A